MKRNELEACAVNIPWMGEVENLLFDDVAIVTGATVIDNENVMLEDLKIEHFGSAKKIIID